MALYKKRHVFYRSLRKRRKDKKNELLKERQIMRILFSLRKSYENSTYVFLYLILQSPSLPTFDGSGNLFLI